MRNSRSRGCPFDRVTELFSAHNLAVLAGPLSTAIIFAIAKYHGFDDGSEDKAEASKKIGAMLGALLWMAVWWILEPVPIAITSLLPLVLFPFFEIMNSDEVAAEFMNDTVVLMLGSFILALAINKYNLHKRMALKVLLLVGGEEMNPRLVLLGFIVGPAFISMWMSNTSSAAMMIPMATGLLYNIQPKHHVERAKSFRRSSSLALQGQLGSGSSWTEESKPGQMLEDEDKLEDAVAKAAIRKYSQGVVLGVTYGVALGGMATLIGCGPTLLIPGIYIKRFPDAPEITFLKWMYFALPLVILWIISMWLWMGWFYCPKSSIPVIQASLNREMISNSYNELGPIRFAEVFILVDFSILVILWVTHSFGESPGWGALFDNFPTDGTVSILACVVLFVVPDPEKKGEMLMNWKNCKDISWSVILLIGGGFALSKGVQSSGVSTWISINLEFFQFLPYYLLIPVLATILSAITEFSSNVAVATLFVPIFAEVALSLNVHPLLLMIPATFASSYAFVLPSGTPPNAIAFGTGYVNVNDMGYPGLFMHVVGILLISVLTPTLGGWIFGLNQPASSLPWLFS